MHKLFLDPFFLTILLAGLGTQLIKILIYRFKHKQAFRFKDLFVTGGMPSSHSSLMVGLATITLLTEGSTPLFFLTLALTVIILRDAMGVRRTAGEEGLTINLLIKKLHPGIKPVHYSLGHTPEQVLVGSIIGLVSAFISYTIALF
ncbi:divergent PAP2 family protein [Candidatus Woesearchaeota archaeon]|nr:divergent PAP2 family protein [Candidatus Woesearchaeota archaeon]HLC80382.1 divergent PAP2 family protein [Candidatus Nanoarchaeia archaeon]